MEGERWDIARLDRDDERPRTGRRVKRALASFGLTIDEAATANACERDELGALAAELDARLGPSTVALITGPSGAGKSTLLATLAERARAAGQRVIDAAALPEPGDERAIVDLFAAPPEGDRGSLAVLASVGLGDATLLPRPAHSLSGGQRARLGIALALDAARAAAGQPTLIIVDELGSGLDDLTARGVCAGIRRAVDRAGLRQHVRIACASACDGPEHALRPDTLLRLDATGRARFDERALSSVSPTFVIEPGSMADYRGLARWHYRAGPPAVPRRVLRAVDARAGVVGVLVTAMPTLNARWRSVVWPGRYERWPPRERARRLNDELRCLARVVVDPRVRSSGVATALVRVYLRDPETPGTEAVAAMGAACPFFARAGMHEYALPPGPADARLLDALERVGLGPEDLVDVAVAAARVEACPLAERELRLWANASRATRSARGDASRNVDELVRLAARRLGCRPRVYAAVVNRGTPHDPGSTR